MCQICGAGHGKYIRHTGYITLHHTLYICIISHILLLPTQDNNMILNSAYMYIVCVHLFTNDLGRDRCARRFLRHRMAPIIYTYLPIPTCIFLYRECGT